MKYSGGNIPDVVINNEVYHDYGQAWVAEQGAIRSSSYYLTAKETHSFVKEVVTHNKVRVFEHLLHHGFTLHLGDLIYLACQHGCLEMTNLIMDAGKVSWSSGAFNSLLCFVYERTNFWSKSHIIYCTLKPKNSNNFPKVSI